MRIFYYVLLLLTISFTSEAQQVKKIDCCQDVTPKATIIINENTNTGTTSSTTTTSTNPSNGVFNFELKSSLNTSAGVYNSSGVLIRTLWSGARYDVGCYTAAWDGYLDDGVTVAPVGNYTIKLLTNNVQYTWEGGIGDSSTEPLNDDTRLRGNDYRSLVVVGQKVFYSWGYSEHSAAVNMLLLSDINKRASTPTGRTTQNTLAMCTDGNIIYSAGDKGYGNYQYATWIVGSYPADNADPYKPVQFSSGQTITANSGSGDLTDNYAISLGTKYIHAIAVQKTGNYLFVARAEINQLQVLNKTTGALVQSILLNNITAVAADNNAFLYAITSGAVKKYALNPDGTLSDTGVSFTGLASPSKLTYSIETGKLAVFDNSTFQVKIYNPSGGNPVNLIGQPGGYTISPYFSADRFVDASFIYYQADGSFWIGQPALHSVLHLNADFSLKEETQHIPTSRSTTADQNAPTHIFSNYNEFVRDYSKPLDNGANGSWKLFANWSKGADVSDLNYDGFKNVITLSNGRRYGQVYSGGGYRICELTATGLRETGLNIGGDIGRDGTLLDYGDNGSNGNQPTGIYKRLLTGFDNNNNPVWSAPVLWVANPPTSNYVPWRGYQNKTSGLTAASDKYIYFDNGIGLPSLAGDNTIGYRLGAAKPNPANLSTSIPVWVTARTTSYNYSGPYPVNGDFDIGNNTGYFAQHSESHAMVYDDDIFWNVNGEFWQNSEANHWNHVDAKTGLLIGHFGTDGNLAKSTTGAPGFAGNAFSVQVVKVGNDYYIYHCDESVHAFVHSWKITGLNTVQITTVPITVSTPITLPIDPTNLMTGVPYRSSGFFGGSGWTMDPSAGDAASVQYPGWRVTTTKNSYSKDDNDIYIESDGNANGTFKTVSRAFGSNNTNNWTLNGSFKINSNLNSNYSMNILDASGKVLVQIRTQYNRFFLNGNYYYELQQDANIASFKFIPFVVQNINGQISVKINDYLPLSISTFEAGGNFKTPATFRVRAGGAGDQQHTLLSVKGLRFVPN